MRIEVLQNLYMAPAVLVDDFLLGFQWLFAFLVWSISTLNSPVLQDSCSNESSLLKGKSWCEDNTDIRGLISRFL